MKKYLNLKETRERLDFTKTLTEEEYALVIAVEKAAGRPLTAEDMKHVLDGSTMDAIKSRLEL